METFSRRLELLGSTNFRDLGGYTGHGGRPVRWRRLFRSDHLGELTSEDVATLDSLNLSRVLDFRGAQERTRHPSVLPGVVVHPLSIEPTVVQGMQALIASGKALTPQTTVELMEQTYRDFVLDNTPRFAQLFDHLLQDGSPLVFHCTAGKDRTGFAAALILTALGVPRSAVMQDYLLTNDFYRQPAVASTLAPQNVLDVLWTVQPRFLDAALEVVQTDFGDLDTYLADGIGLGPREVQRMHALYLA